MIDHILNTTAHIGNMMHHIGDMTGHIGNTTRHIANMMHHIGDTTDHIANMAARIGITAGRIRNPTPRVAKLGQPIAMLPAIIAHPPRAIAILIRQPQTPRQPTNTFIGKMAILVNNC